MIIPAVAATIWIEMCVSTVAIEPAAMNPYIIEWLLPCSNHTVSIQQILS